MKNYEKKQVYDPILGVFAHSMHRRLNSLQGKSGVSGSIPTSSLSSRVSFSLHFKPHVIKDVTMKRADCSF